ncbi:TldD/PmbA family protein [Aristophania vespae]|uniref:TldD/PmbA family protein n=1 Tax=Aristophania vespae TaxID=2697033 RepID=UPI002351292D|nr:TldD/PmbA family protein [Aristophania vespae]UMM64646.1 Metalloprotease PmbA [Aristophania vespae]
MKNIDTLLNQALEQARLCGADQADVMISQSESNSALVRKGVIEGIKHSEQLGLGLRVFKGKKLALISSNDLSKEALRHCAERACAMADALPDSPYDGLPEASAKKLDAHAVDQLDLVDRETALDTKSLVEQAYEMEQIALDHKNITNSNGSSAGYGSSLTGYASTNGFQHYFKRTHFSRAISVVAGHGEAMERDYASHSALHFSDLRSIEELGREAAERALRRLNPKKPKTASLPLIFDRRVSPSLIGHLVSALNGAAIVQKTSFLTEKMGQDIFSPSVTIEDNPLRLRGLGSRPFDMEGNHTTHLNLVENGALKNWLLDTRCARQLGLLSNGHAVRSYKSMPHPGVSNVTLRPGSLSPEQLMNDVSEGILITEMMGNAVNLLTGDYSRGASGFMIRNGKIAEPLSGFTIAGNLNDMFARLEPGNDLFIEHIINAPSVRIDGMTIAGL